MNKDEIFFAENGLTTTSANHIANIAVMKLVSNFYQVKSIAVDAQTRDDLGFSLIMKMCRTHGIG